MVSETARHEAAHAVAAAQYGIRIKNVGIDGHGGGQVEIIDTAGDRIHRGHSYAGTAVAFAVVALAGPIAGADAGARAVMSNEDRELFRFATWLGGWSDVTEDALRAMASDFVDSHWDEIEAVALALERRLELTHEEVVAVIAGKELPIHG